MCALQLILSGLLGGTGSSCSLLHPIPRHSLGITKLQVPAIPCPHREGILLPIFNKFCDYLMRSTAHTKFIYDLPMDLKVPG